MIILEDIDTVYFDVDDTLVMWDGYEDPKWDGCTIQVSGLTLMPHYRHIKLLRYHKQRGRKIVVWSAGGSAWAYDVVLALGLERHVDVIINKPRWYYDDLPPTEGIGEPKYCTPPGGHW